MQNKVFSLYLLRNTIQKYSNHRNHFPKIAVKINHNLNLRNLFSYLNLFNNQ
jgi:hypothetical protein